MAAEDRLSLFLPEANGTSGTAEAYFTHQPGLVTDPAGDQSAGSADIGVLPWDGEEVSDVSLHLEDLMAGVDGEIVIFNDSSFTEMVLITAAKVIDSGRVAQHVTAEGEDVSNCAFLVFDNGIRLFYSPELTIHVMAGTG